MGKIIYKDVYGTVWYGLYLENTLNWDLYVKNKHVTKVENKILNEVQLDILKFFEEYREFEN